MKTQPMKWGEIFANYILEKELISKIYTEHMPLSKQKKTSDFKMRNWIAVFPKKTYRSPTGTGKDVQHH